jgi:hypothetical protein
MKNRYKGIGGTYIRIGGEVFPADAEGRALPHLDNVPDVEDDGVPAPEEAAPAPTQPEPEPDPAAAVPDAPQE